jgi:hypothetical protein
MVQPFFSPYVTNEFKSPTTTKSTNQALIPENTNERDVVQPSGEAKTTGTPITRKKERRIKQKSAN